MSWALGMVACGILREASGGSATSTVCLPGHVPVSVPFYNNFYHLHQSKHDGPHTACQVRQTRVQISSLWSSANDFTPLRPGFLISRWDDTNHLTGICAKHLAHSLSSISVALSLT